MNALTANLVSIKCLDCDITEYLMSDVFILKICHLFLSHNQQATRLSFGTQVTVHVL